MSETTLQLLKEVEEQLVRLEKIVAVLYPERKGIN
jgi:hypothetical protein